MAIASGCVFYAEFREYCVETAEDGFLLAKEGFEMLEFVIVVLCVLVVLVFLYIFNVLKIKTIAKKHQEKILNIIQDEKGLIFLCMIMLALCFLVYAPYQKYKKDKETISQMEGQLLAKKSKKIQPVVEALKPLPDQIMPQSESHIVKIKEPETKPQETEQISQIKPVVFDTNDLNADADSPENLFSSLKQKADQEAAKKEAQKKQEAIERENYINALWSNSVPNYKQEMVSLNDYLAKLVRGQNDGISRSEDYFDALPQTIDPNGRETIIAEIKFQKNTNLDFKIFLDDGQNEVRRPLKITCSGGYLYSIPEMSGNSFDMTVYDENGSILDSANPPITESKPEAKRMAELLVAEQVRYFEEAEQRNKGVTNIVDKTK